MCNYLHNERDCGYYCHEMYEDIEKAVESLLEGSPVPASTQVRLQENDINLDALKEQLRNSWNFI